MPSAGVLPAGEEETRVECSDGSFMALEYRCKTKATARVAVLLGDLGI